MNLNWNYVPFEQAFKWKEKSKIKSGDGKSIGKYKMFVCSDTEIKHYDKYLESGESLVFGTGGKASCHFVNEPFAYSTDCFVAQRKSDNTISKFYYYYLRRNRLGELQSTFAGSGLQHTSKKKIDKILVPILPYKEQARIVTRIEELFSQLDNGIDTLQTIKQQLTVYRQAVLKEAFSNIDDRYYKPMSTVMVGTPQNGIYKPKNTYGHGVRILRIDGFYDGFIVPDYEYKRLSLTEDEINKYTLNVNDLVVNRVNSMPYLGKCALVRKDEETTVFESNMMRICLDEERINPEYLTYYLSSLAGKKELKKNAKQAVNQASINQTDVGNALVPIPENISVQLNILAEIESRLSVCDSIEQTVETALKQAEALRQSILKEAFEGRLI